MALAFRTRKPLPALFATPPPAYDALTAPLPGAELAAPGEREHYTEYVFPVAGQGTIAFTITAQGPFRIVLAAEKEASRGRPVIVLEVGERKTAFRNRNDAAPSSLIGETAERSALLEPGVPRRYWLSLDTQNRRLRFGKGQLLPQLTVFEVVLPKPPGERVEDPYAYLSTLRYVALSGPEPRDVSEHYLWPAPVTVGLPARLVPSDTITLDDIAANECTVIANLEPAAQLLYGNVAGPQIRLDTPDFPEFAAAIEYSINTPGRWCYQTLEAKAKAKEFGKDEPDGTYLRITIGPNKGDSPGSPYVLEIWPGGHYSPIHDHGKANAIIKVLHGDIWVELYPELAPHVRDYFAEAVFHAGEVTFLSPQFYQVHRLINYNPRDQMTATIQCYRYADGDTRHYEYFDYIGADDKVKQFPPNSDCEFAEFKKLIQQEWAAR